MNGEREAAGGLPVELASIHNHTADGRAMAADELGGRFHDDVSTPLDGPRQKRGSRGIVDHQRHPGLVRDACQAFKIGDVELGIAQGLGIHRSCLLIDCCLETVKVIRIDKPYRNAEPRQRVVKQVVRAPVERGGGNDFVAQAGERGDREGLGGLTGGGGERGGSPFEGSYPLLEHVGGRVHDAGVDVAEFL